MSEPLWVLIIDDEEDEALLLAEELRRGGFEPEYVRVDTAAALDAALLSRPWDLVLLDYVMPRLTVFEALNAVKAHDLDLPVIVISIRVEEEEVAVAVMKAGAQDFIRKDRVTRLIPAIRRELTEAAARREARRAAAAQEQERLRFYAILEHLPGFVSLISPDHSLVYINRPLRELFGEPGGRRCYEFFQQRQDPCEKCPPFEVFASRQPQEWELIMPDGRVFQMYSYPFSDPDGSPLVMEMGLDITARQQAEAERTRLIDIIEAAPELIGFATPEGRICYLNRAGWELLGRAPDRDLRIKDIRPAWAWEKVLREIIPTALREGIWSGETAVLGPDGREIPVEQVLMAHKGPDGEVQYISTIMRDIRPRKEQEEAIRALNEDLRRQTAELARQKEEAVTARLWAETASRAKTDFIANLSHELRTPLNAVLGFAQVLQDELVGKLNKGQKGYVAHILEGGRRLEALLGEMLDFAQIDAGRMELEVSRFLVGDLLRSAVLIFQERAMRQQLSLKMEMAAAADLEIEADIGKLKQVMVNLLENACKFTPEGGAVVVQARAVGPAEGGELGEGEFIEISVADTGIGIKPEDLPRLFWDFGQLESPYTKKYAGTGLGLALTRKLVELHGGKIGVASEWGRGSNFTFTIPIRQGLR